MKTFDEPEDEVNLVGRDDEQQLSGTLQANSLA